MNHHHRSVRAAAVTHFRKHLEKYSMFWDTKDTNDQIMEKKGIEGFKDYVEEVSTVGNWAGNLEIAALATTLDRPILLLHEYGQIYIFNPEGSKPVLYLDYQTCGRYESLLVSKETSLTLRTKADRVVVLYINP